MNNWYDDAPVVRRLGYSKRRANKEHKCRLCMDPIRVGQTYIYEFGIEDGYPYADKTHEECDLRMKVGEM